MIFKELNGTSTCLKEILAETYDTDTTFGEEFSFRCYASTLIPEDGDLSTKSMMS